MGPLQRRYEAGCQKLETCMWLGQTCMWLAGKDLASAVGILQVRCQPWELSIEPQKQLMRESQLLTICQVQRVLKPGEHSITTKSKAFPDCYCSSFSQFQTWKDQKPKQTNSQGRRRSKDREMEKSPDIPFSQHRQLGQTLPREVTETFFFFIELPHACRRLAKSSVCIFFFFSQ